MIHDENAVPPPGMKTPKPLYSCAVTECAMDTSWPADDLYWCPELGDWYCQLCLSDIATETEELTRGISLKEYLKIVNRSG